jgi:HEAT repeat protein
LENELKSLRDDIKKADFLEQEQAAELETWKDEMLRVEAEVAAMQVATEAEIGSLAADRDALAAAAGQMLTKVGVAAVPGLTEMLGSERAPVRAWAANVLGELGSTAQDATPALNRLLNDSDEQVRNAAQQALNRIALATPR